MSDWQPIETVPRKNRKWIRLWRPRAGVGRWQQEVAAVWDRRVKDFIWPDESAFSGGDDFSWVDDGAFYEGRGTFTHWMPSAEPPK